MQEAHLYAKLKGEIYTPYIGISLVRSSGCFYKGNYFYDFFSGGSMVHSEVNSGGGGWNFFFFLLVGFWNKWCSPLPGIFKWNSPNQKTKDLAARTPLKTRVKR